MLRSSGVGFRIRSPATMEERRGRLRNLTTLRQRGREVGDLAQAFWTMAVGLGYNDEALKDLFNDCLDDPLPRWEMKGLEILDFWGFTKYLHHRAQWDAVTTPESPDKTAASPAPQHKRAASPEPLHKMAESTPVLPDKMADSTPESPVKVPPTRHHRGRRRRQASTVPQGPEAVPEQPAAVPEEVPEQPAAVPEVWF